MSQDLHVPSHLSSLSLLLSHVALPFAQFLREHSPNISRVTPGGWRRSGGNRDRDTKAKAWVPENALHVGWMGSENSMSFVTYLAGAPLLCQIHAEIERRSVIYVCAQALCSQLTIQIHVTLMYLSQECGCLLEKHSTPSL